MRHLDLGNCLIGNKTVEEIAHNCTNLKYPSLKGCKGISEEVMKKLDPKIKIKHPDFSDNEWIVEAKVGKQKVNCRLEPGFLGPSMCSDKLLKKIGGKISRKLTPEEKDSKFVREETTSPLGLVIIPLTFTSNIINNHRLSNYESITIPTEVLVEKYDHKTPNYILLGNN
ncbi:5821_t:CDS:2 [Entrophospora sp. SA101]|nr:5821_t:CDS:2 [Entrophospora sp. SA101]